MKFLSWLLRSVFRYRSDVVTVNLSRCFPEWDYARIEAVHKRFYRHLSTIFLETLRFGRYRSDKGRRRLHGRRLVEITNPEEFNRLYAGATQVMVLQAHTGNWELIGGLFNYSYGTPLDFGPPQIAVTYKKLHSGLMDRFIRWNRTGPVADLGFTDYLETEQVLRFALQNRSERKVYCFITDQFPYSGNRNATLRFMGQETAVMTGAAALAVKLDMAVAYLRFECREDGGYRITAVPISDHAAGEDPLEITRKFYQYLEEDIRKQPWNYLWTHKRWK